jgi:hypothetical protein
VRTSPHVTDTFGECFSTIMGHIGSPSEANLILVTTGGRCIQLQGSFSHEIFQISPKFHLEAITPGGMEVIPSGTDVYKLDTLGHTTTVSIPHCATVVRARDNPWWRTYMRMVAWNIVLAAELPSTMASDTCTALDYVYFHRVHRRCYRSVTTYSGTYCFMP